MATKFLKFRLELDQTLTDNLELIVCLQTTLQLLKPFLSLFSSAFTNDSKLRTVQHLFQIQKLQNSK